MINFHPALDYRLLDKDGEVIAVRRSLGALRNYARMAAVGRRGIVIEGPDGQHPVRTPRPTA